MEIFGIILSAIFGAIFGSYATLFAYRLPLGESCFGRYFGPKSRCPKCDSTIRTRELIPLVNWLFTFGRCSQCKTKIPRTHLFTELSCTILFVICYLQFSFGEEFIIYSLICVICVILIVTDFTHKVFPYQLLNALLTIGLINRVLMDQTILTAIYSLLVGVILVTVFYQIFNRYYPKIFEVENASFDYVKFVLIASLCLDLPNFLLYFLAVMIIFSVIIYTAISAKRNDRALRFGSALIVPFLWLMLS